MAQIRPAALAALLLPAAIACSENELRVVYEEPTLYEQPDALGPTEWIDEYQQRTVAASDILFVVDSSCSMGDEQEELSANFDGFIRSFVDSTLDYHIGVVDGDLSGMSASEKGRLIEKRGVRWIEPDTPDKIDTFNEMANLGGGGSGSCEMGLEASFQALQRRTNPGDWNDGFYRPDALLSLIIITDEDDQAEGFNPFGGCEGITPDEYIPWLQGLKGFNWEDQVIFTGILGDRPNGCSANDNNADYGEAYWEVIDDMDGNFLSVCSTDWSEFLIELGLEAAGLKRSFYLQRIPDPETLRVYLDEVEAEDGTWSYDRVANAVTFPIESIPEPLVRVKVTYTLIEDQGATVEEEDTADE